MITTYKYEKLTAYPHLKPADTLIWERFILKFPNAYTTVQYDLNVGEGRGQVNHDDPTMVKSFGMLTSRKIDVVGFGGKTVDIFEVKPHAGPSALGQVIGYQHLYNGYIDPHAKTRAILLTDSYENDMKLLSAKMGVVLIVV